MSFSRLMNGEALAIAAASFAAGAAVCFALLRTEPVIVLSPKKAIPAEILASPYQAHAKLAVDLALKAGSNMFAYCDEKGTATEHDHDIGAVCKELPTDFCTKVDVENERLVMEGIQRNFPNHKIIGEETVGSGKIPPLTNEPTWIIDPIDGTTNFASGLPLTCVSIGFCQDGKPTVGIVYAPMTDELYIAVAGYGAFRNGVKLMSKQKNTSLSNAIVDFEFGYSREAADITKMVNVVHHFMNRGCRAARQFGSGVLDVCYVATGRIDVVYSGVAKEGWKPWDLCAAYVIATEAGCVMETFDQERPGEFDLYTSNHICATNRGLLEEIRACVKKEYIRT